MRRLIINADDYGLTRGVSQGIRYAFSCGAIASTTAMMNMPGSAKDVEIAKRDTPYLPIGIHLTLTAGRPVTPAEKIPTLVDGEGRFLARNSFLAKLDGIQPEEAGLEFRAQIEALQALDVRPDHLDSHHFVSYLSPALLAQMLRLAEEFKLPVRPPAADDAEMGALFPGLSDTVTAFLKAGAREEIRRASIPTADRLFLTFYDKTATQKHLTWILGSLPDGVSEIMCHPGMSDGDLRAASDYAEERGYELNVLTESGLPGILRQREIDLVSYGRLNA
ncbi:MAG: ChbG/HpnK family deacetylase [Anaerolineales bacterium]|nr:ChbG/HpnK family deacetylase [Anaerolineales bacterium]